MAQLQLVATLQGHTERVWQAAWSPEGSLLATCGQDQTVRVWAREQQWACAAVLDKAHSKTIRSVSWHPKGHLLCAASFDGTTSVWRRRTGSVIAFELVATVEGHENEVKCVSWDPSGRLLATCGRDRTVWVWEGAWMTTEDAKTGEIDFECQSVLGGHSADVKWVDWHPTQPLLVSGSYDATIKAWRFDGDDWYCAGTLRGHDSTVWCTAFDPAGDRLVSCSDDFNLIVWDRPAADADADAAAGDASDASDGWRAACTASGYHRRCVFHVDWAHCDGTDWIATAAADNALRVIAVARAGAADGGLPTCRLGAAAENAHDADVNCVRWGPEWLATCGDDCMVKLWRLVP